MERKIIILGAGPTGLGAGYRLQELGYNNWVIYDRNSYVGGLATSFTDDAGFTYDIGGHVMFSHYKYFDDLVDKLLGDNYTEIMRQAWVWMMGRFIPYPFQNNIGYLPKEVVLECVLGLLEASNQPEKVKQARTFDELIDAQFGKGIAKHFMKPYNFKVWAHPIDHMSRDWLGERVAMPNLERILTNVLLDQPDVGWGPNNKFKYPLYGGTGSLYEPFTRYVGDHLHLNKNVVRIDPTAKQVYFEDGSSDHYDLLLSTMPLDLLVDRLEGAPDSIREAAGLLHHSSGLIVGVGVNGAVETEKCWMYFPEPDSPFKPQNKNTIIDEVVQGLLNTGLLLPDDMDRIASTYLIDVDYSYPVPTLERNAALAAVQPYLMQHDIYSRGRFGAWEYEIGNMDHSVMQGVEVVNRWLLGEPEVTWIDFNGEAHTNGAALRGLSGHGRVTAGPQPYTPAKGKARVSVATNKRTVQPGS